jgi:recombination protein RecR
VKRIDYPPALQSLVAQLKRMPGIGPRSAERIALWLLSRKDAQPAEIIRAMTAAVESLRPCEQCGFFSAKPLCEFCTDSSRTNESICVVENATDILPLERTGMFRGKYHALAGKLSPLDHVGPDDIRIEALIARVKNDRPSEIILALGGDVEGEATANYLAGLLAEFPVTVTRIAQGLPAGGGLESADELTLSRALSGRVRLTATDRSASFSNPKNVESKHA